MLIYIDESGIFANPGNRHIALSTVGALVVPEKISASIFADYKRILHRWGNAGKEIKGKELDEIQASHIIAMLAKYKVFFSCNLIDLGLHKPEQIKAHKIKQSEKIVENITEQDHPNLVEQLLS